MKLLVIAIAAPGWFLAATERASTGPLLQALIAALGGGTVTVLITRFIDRKRGAVELKGATVEVEGNAISVAEMARQMAMKSMTDVAAVQEEISRLNAELSKAKDRIAELEKELAHAREGRERLVLELDRRRREADAMKRRMAELELALQGKEPRRHPDLAAGRPHLIEPREVHPWSTSDA